MSIEQVTLDLKELINETLGLLEVSAKWKGLDLVFETDGSLPAQVVTDPTRIRQILINVIGNAIKFTSQGGILVHASYIQSTQCAVISVQDSGIGISSEQTDLLFEPFMQADASTTRIFGGTGLGLALSRRLARALGGDLVLSGTLLKYGSTFTINIPMIRSVSRKEPTPDQTVGKQDLKLSHPLQGQRILVVDDNPVILMLLERQLAGSGASVTIAMDGSEGIEAALARPFDLVFMDVQMPNLDGLQATESLRRVGYKVPIVALTAHADVGSMKQALERGCDGHIAKPFDRVTLVEAVKKYSRHHPAVVSPSVVEARNQNR